MDPGQCGAAVDPQPAAEGAPAKKPRGPRRPRRVNPFKHPKRAFMWFSVDYRNGLLQENPHMKVPEQGQRAGDAWRAMSAAERAPYEVQAEQDQQRYIRDKQAARPNWVMPGRLFGRRRGYCQRFVIGRPDQTMTTTTSQKLSKKKKFVSDGIFKAELNNFLMRELAEDGYSGVEVRKTPTRTEVIIMATRTMNVLGEKGRRIRELTSLVQKRFNMPENSVELYAEKVSNRGLCAVAQCESLRYKLLGGLAVRRSVLFQSPSSKQIMGSACYGVLRFIMESQAKGCEVVVSGKLRGQRAKAMKFTDGLMIHSGQPTLDYIQQAVRHVKMRQGVLGVKVKIMLPYDPKGSFGPKEPLPDHIIVSEPKEDSTAVIKQPYSNSREPKKQDLPPQPPVQAQAAQMPHAY